MGAEEKPQSKLQATLISGAAATGKTETLVRRTARMIREGVNPEQILVIAASENGAAELLARLEHENLPACPRVASARRVAKRLLGTPEVYDYLGYRARLPRPFEQDALDEDIKSSGESRGRGRAMLDFFERTYSDLAEDADDFPYGWEEEGMLDYYKRCQRYVGLISEGMMLAAVARTLMASPGMREREGVAHVVVDDFGLLSHASQAMCIALAKESITVAADEDATARVQDRYPYPKGTAEFVKRCQAEVIRLSSCRAATAVAKAINAIRADEGISASQIDETPGSMRGRVGRLYVNAPIDELAVLTRVADMLTAGENADAADATVAVTSLSPVWLANIKRYFAAKGILFESMPDIRALRCRFGATGNEAALAALLLTLLADPRDAAAWRAWCGMGSYTAASVAFLRLRNVCLEEDAELCDVLDDLTLGLRCELAAAPEMTHVMARYTEGRAIIEHLSGLSGRALLDALKKAAGNTVLPVVFEKIFDQHGDETTPKRFAEALDEACWHPALARRARIYVGLPQELAGLTYASVIVSGAINGFILPTEYFDTSLMEEEKKAKVRVTAASQLYQAFGMASQNVFVTGFTELPLEKAAGMKLHVDRIRGVGGVRMARVGASTLCSALPEIDGGL